MPAWSSPSPSSRGEHSMPFDHSPRILRRPISMPLGMTVPTVASGTRSPAAMLNAPHPICRASPSPASTSTSWMRSALGWGRGGQHPGDDDAVEPLAQHVELLDGQTEVAQVLADALGVALDGGEVPEPGQEDLHRHELRDA